MVDTTSSEINVVSRQLRAVLVATTVLFCLGTVAWLIEYGKPDNSLHQSAMSWSYTVLIATMAAIGLQALSLLIPAILAKK